MINSFKKAGALFALLMAGIMLTGTACASGSPSQEVPGSERRPALIRSVVEYGIDFETGEWYPRLETEYSYENGYPVTVVYKYPDDGYQYSKTFEYTFEDGLPVSMKQFDEEGVLESTTEYTNGKISRIDAESESGGTVTETLFSYTNSEEFFSLLLFSRASQSFEGGPGFTMEEVDGVSVTTRNGLLEKTVNTGLYANWNEGEEKEWLRFNGTYTANYDDDGILSRTSTEFRAGPPGIDDLFDLTWEDGRVTEAVWSQQDSEQDAMPMARFSFEYYDETEIDPARYATMINAHIMGNDGNFYRFYWY